MVAAPGTKRGAFRAIAALLPALSIAACTVGPDYKRPPVTIAPEFRAQIGPAEAASVADLPWWGLFGDPALQSLIAEGLQNNYDLQIAVARIEQARAIVKEVKSQAKPQIGYDASAGRQKEFIPFTQGVDQDLVFNSVGANINASWELDLWGRIRRQTQSARAKLLGQEDARRGVMLTLVSDLASGYFRLLELDRELAIAKESVAVYGKTLELFRLRYEAGLDSDLPVQRARADYEFATSRVADLTRAIAQQENALSVLVGAPPRAIVRGRTLTEQVMPVTPVGATSDLLQRRPDILQAEQGMVSANADVGAAIADYFPKVALQGSVGGLGAGAGNGFSGFNVWSFALGVAGPIYTSGRLKAVVQERRAFWDETIAQYKRTVLYAFQETSDALIAQQTLVDRRKGLELQVLALRRSFDLALIRYDAGRASYFEVLEAAQQLYPAEDVLAQTQRDQLLAVVNLYKALGGGWKLTDAEWSKPS